MNQPFPKTRYPLIQAPMAGSQSSRLAAAVIRAGGIGSLPAALWTTEKLIQQLEHLRTDCPGGLYNLNFFANPKPEISDGQVQRWHALLQPYFEEFNLDAANLPPSPQRNSFDERALAVVQQYRPPIVSFHFGLPEPDLLEAVHQTGAQIWSSATSVAEARWLAERGADAVIAQGWEAGGHRGWFLERNPQQQTGLFALLPNIVNAVGVPVIAAGGISDAAAVRAAFELGATAIQAGTAFLLADESDASAAHRAYLQSSRAGQTVVTNLISGGGARGIPNRLIEELGIWHEDALPFPLSGQATGALKACAEAQGRLDFSTFWAGQNAPLARPGSAAEIIERLMNT